MALDSGQPVTGPLIARSNQAKSDRGQTAVLLQAWFNLEMVPVESRGGHGTS